MKLFFSVLIVMLAMFSVPSLNATSVETELYSVENVVSPDSFTEATLVKSELLAESAGIFRKCKWRQRSCPGGGTVEECLTNGNGNNCSCGKVTRECGSPNEQ